MINDTDDTVYDRPRFWYSVCCINWIISVGDNESKATVVHTLLLVPKVLLILGHPGILLGNWSTISNASC